MKALVCLKLSMTIAIVWHFKSPTGYEDKMINLSHSFDAVRYNMLRAMINEGARLHAPFHAVSARNFFLLIRHLRKYNGHDPRLEL